MLDLRAKLLAAGLVTAEQVTRAEDAAKRAEDKAHAKRDGKRGPPPAKRGPPRAPKPPALSDEERWQKRVQQLKDGGKSEQYEALRGWVERTRLDDPKSLPSEHAQRFHFPKGDGTIGWVTVEPELHAKLEQGEAAIVAFMGFNGLLHAVVPRAVALDVHVVRPEWLRALAQHEFEPLPIAPPRKRTKKKGGDGDGEGEGDASAEARDPADAGPSDEASAPSSDGSPSDGSPSDGSPSDGSSSDGSSSDRSSSDASSSGASSSDPEG